MSEVQHENVYFSGHVQGVGFRYAALQVAKEFEVTGFVRNLPDGRVQIEAEGMKPEIDDILKALGEAMQGYVRSHERHGARREAQFRGFTIR